MRELLAGLVERRLGKVVEARFAEEPVVVLNADRALWARAPCSASWPDAWDEQ